jgi:antitoxin CptB
MTSASAERSRLRWRCRRGMRELDVLLERWLDRDWEQADERCRAAFERLLECEDDRLWSWMTGRETPDDDELADIVRRVAG